MTDHPRDMPSVIPMLSYEDVAQAADWIAYQSPRHHAEACDLARAWSTTPYVVDGVLVYVDDIEAHFERAQASGATLLSPLEDNPGVRQRNYRAEDLEGHRWMFAQPV